jgi:hypothetical protein
MERILPTVDELKALTPTQLRETLLKELRTSGIPSIGSIHPNEAQAICILYTEEAGMSRADFDEVFVEFKRGIPTLQEHPVESEYSKVDNIADFELLVQQMSWEDSTGFTRDTGIHPDELLGKYWTVVHNRVFLKD